MCSTIIFLHGVGRVEILFVYLALSFAVCGLFFFSFVLLGCYMLLSQNAIKSHVKELDVVL